MKSPANEADIASAAASSGLHRAGAVAMLLLGANVHQPEVAVDHTSGSRLSHAVQHYCAEWVHHYN